MLKGNKIVYSFLAAFLAVSLLAGCASPQATQTVSQPTQTPQNTAAVPTAAATIAATQSATQATAPGATQAATAAATQAASQGGGALVVMTHDSFAISDKALAVFESQNNVKVQFVKAGDAGAALNKAILSKGNPIADVFYGVDNTFLSRALDEDIFQPYASTALAGIPDTFKLDPQSRALPVDYGDVCLNYDKAYFTQKGITPPQNLEDLTKPEYKSLLVVENPASSSPGLAFLLATVGHFGADKYLDYWKGLVANDVKVVNGWEEAYYTEFSGSSGKGPRPVVVSYSSSPAFELIGAQTPMKEPPTAAITDNGSCFRQIEFVGILKGAKNPELAKKWVDFMLSTTFQEDMPNQMYVFPVNPQAKLDDTFQKFLNLNLQPSVVSLQDIAANRDKWIQDWTQTVLR